MSTFSKKLKKSSSEFSAKEDIRNIAKFLSSGKKKSEGVELADRILERMSPQQRNKIIASMKPKASIGHTIERVGFRGLNRETECPKPPEPSSESPDSAV